MNDDTQPPPRDLHGAFTGLDLNLLVTLDALLEARSVTETAERFGVTQSAMSHRLARLREFFGDALLVAAGDALVLTPRAELLQEPLREALIELRVAVQPTDAFVPAEAHRDFVIAASDLVEINMLPGLLRFLSEAAPHVGIRMGGRGSVRGEALIRGKVDLAIAPAEGSVPGVGIEQTAGIRQCKLLAEGFAVVARGDHPRIRGKSLTLKRYLSESHVLVAPQGQPGSVVDACLRREGRSRTIAARVANFLSAPFLVAQTDLLLTCPTSLAAATKDALRLRVFKPPVSLPSTPIFLYWHERMHQDPGHRWLREHILSLTRKWSIETTSRAYTA